MIAIVAFLIAIVHLGIWFLGVWMGKRAVGLVRRSMFFVLGPSLLLSPAVLIGGHGGFPFPAIASLVIQPTVSPGLKLASFFSTYFVLLLLRILIVLALRVRNNGKGQPAAPWSKS